MGFRSDESRWSCLPRRVFEPREPEPSAHGPPPGGDEMGSHDYLPSAVLGDLSVSAFRRLVIAEDPPARDEPAPKRTQPWLGCSGRAPATGLASHHGPHRSHGLRGLRPDPARETAAWRP